MAYSRDKAREDVKLGLYALGTFATAFTVYYFFKKDSTDDSSGELDEGFYPPSETAGADHRIANQRANQIYTAMDGIGTDELAIVQAQNLVSAAMLKLIYNKFGIRDGQNLGQWYQGDLSGYWLNIVRAQWNNKGVKPPF